MVLELERIIRSVVQGDQDAVQLLLDTYNTQYAECFFFNSEEQERKKQRRLDEFRKNKVRDHTSDSDSEADSDDDKPDLLLRQHLAAALLAFVSGPLQPAVLRVCLQTLRILSRDRRALDPLVTDEALFTLAHLGGIAFQQDPDQQGGRSPEGPPEGADGRTSSDPDGPDGAAASASGSAPGVLLLPCGRRDTWKEEQEQQEQQEDGEVCRKEAIKVLCNVIYNSPRAQERVSRLRFLQALWESLKLWVWSRTPPGGQFFRLRLLFLLTALRPELRLQLHQARGLSVLTTALEQCLAVRCAEDYQVLPDSSAPPVTRDGFQEVIEILKTLFNIAHVAHRQEPDEEESALYRHLAAVLRHCLLLSCDEEDTLEELQGHTVNVLSIMPLACLDVLLSVPVEQAAHSCDGVSMDCVHMLLLFMERRLNRGQKLKEKLTPVLNLLTESSRVHRETRRFLRQKILPPLRDVGVRPEQDDSVRGQLVRLMTHVDTDVKHCAAELLFVLCKENVSRFVKYTGYGNAAGLLAARGLLNGRRNSGDGQPSSQYSSDSDSDTEEYREARARINPVTGRVEAEQPDPMEGLTEEEREEEARRLICMINRLSRERIIQPVAVTAEGRLCPWGQMRGCTLEEEEDEEEEDEEEEEEEENLPQGNKDKLE